MKKILFGMISLACVTILFLETASAGKFDNIISAADVEKITGISEIKQVPRVQSNKFKNGDINFVSARDEPLLMIEFRPAFVFSAMKADSGYFKTSLPGIGEEAFTSPSFDPQFSVNLIKGKHVAVVTTHIDGQDKKKTVIKMEHLIALAKLVAARM